MLNLHPVFGGGKRFLEPEPAWGRSNRGKREDARRGLRSRSMLANLLRRSRKAAFPVDKFAPLRKELDQLNGCHILCGTGEKTGVRAEPAVNRRFQGVPREGLRRFHHHLHYFMAVNLVAHGA